MAQTAVLFVVVALVFAAHTTSAVPSVACNPDGSSNACLCSKTGGVVLEVDCSGLGLLDVPSGIPATTLILRLRNNQIMELTNQPFRLLAALEELHLQNNVITSFDVGAFVGLRTLKFLYAWNNYLEVLDETVFDSLSQLDSLLLHNNEITSLPDNVFAGLARLKTLRLDNNRITSGGISPNTFLNLKLTTLYMNINRLTTLDSRIFQQLTDLTVLRLDTNSISSIPPGTFSFSTNLLILNLESNYITSLAASQFSALRNLQDLNLQRNLLTEVRSATLSPLTSLRFLKLNDNALTAISESAITALPMLQQLFLGGSNPWYCCGMEWVRDNSTVVQDISNIGCRSPQLVAGVKLYATAGPIRMCETQQPDAPAAPTVVQGTVTATSVQVTWLSTHGNAFEVDWYRLTVLNVATAAVSVVQCPGGQYPERIDNGPMTSTECRLLARHPLTDAPTNPLVFTITGLSPYFEYRFSVQAASTEMGYGPVSRNSTIQRTLEAAPSVPAQPLVQSIWAASNNGGTHMLVSWVAPAHPNGVITEYIVRVFESALLIQNISTNGFTTEVVVTSLHAYTTYSFSVEARTAAGSSGQSNRTVATSDEGVPAIEPAGVVVIPTSTSLSFSWNPVTFPDSNGIITSYKILLDGTVAYQGLATTAVIGSLSPGRSYVYELVASTKRGEGPRTAPRSILTLPAAPSRPLAPLLAAVNATAISVSWQPPTQTNGAIVRYTFYIKKSSVANFSSGVNVTTATSLVFSSLEPATSYDIAFDASTALGTSAQSPTASTSTKESAPEPVAAPSQVDTTSTSVSLSWDAPAKPNGVIVKYQVVQLSAVQTIEFYDPVVDLTPKVLATLSGTQTSVVVSSLTPATVYEFGILASTAADTSEIIETSFHTTADAPPSRPNIIGVDVLSFSALRVRWAKPTAPNGNITKYEIRNGLASGSQPIVLYSSHPENATLWAILGNLTDDTPFELTVTAFTSAGASLPSHPRTARTDTVGKSMTTMIVIIVIVLLFVVLLFGFVYEQSRRKSKKKVSPSNSETRLTHPTGPHMDPASPLAFIPNASRSVSFTKPTATAGGGSGGRGGGKPGKPTHIAGNPSLAISIGLPAAASALAGSQGLESGQQQQQQQQQQQGAQEAGGSNVAWAAPAPQPIQLAQQRRETVRVAPTLGNITEAPNEVGGGPDQQQQQQQQQVGGRRPLPMQRQPLQAAPVPVAAKKLSLSSLTRARSDSTGSTSSGSSYGGDLPSPPRQLPPIQNAKALVHKQPQSQQQQQQRQQRETES